MLTHIHSNKDIPTLNKMHLRHLEDPCSLPLLLLSSLAGIVVDNVVFRGEAETHDVLFAACDG